MVKTEKQPAPVVASIEVSTSKIRLLLMSISGVIVWCDEIKQGLKRGKGGSVTQSPTRWLNAISLLFKRANSQGHVLKSIKTIGVCSTTPTLVPVYPGGRLVENQASLWCDTRAFGRPNSAGTNSALRRLLAIYHLERELFQRIPLFADAGPLIAAQLTGNLVSGKAMLIQKFAWREEGQFDLSGLEDAHDSVIESVLAKIPSEVVDTGAIVGGLNHDWSSRLGLQIGIPVVLCAYDSICATVGANVFVPKNVLLLSVGTSVALSMCPLVQGNNLSPWPSRRALLPTESELITGGFEAGMQSIDVVHKRMKLTCAAANDNFLERIAARYESQCGVRCVSLPFCGVSLRAPFPGLVLDTVCGIDSFDSSDETSLTALRRGVACFVRYCIQDLERRGAETSQIHIVGGGTKSRSFCELVANCCRRPVKVFDHKAAAFGAALIAVSSTFGLPEAMKLAAEIETRMPVCTPTDKPEKVRKYEDIYLLFEQRLNAEVSIANNSADRIFSLSGT